MPDDKATGTSNQVMVDDETLRKIAEVLDIPEAEPSPPPPPPSPPPPPPSPPPLAPSRRRRQRK